MNLESKVKAYIERNNMIARGDTVLAGISGGADSTCLLVLLHKLSKDMDFSLVVVHVNHGLRTDAEDDALYVKKLCRERDITYILHEADIKAIAAKKAMTEEEAGRYERYRVFEELSSHYNAGKIAIAHNQNDLAETMLYNMFRGSGLHGVIGIRPIRGKIIRPLLETSRAEIEQYLDENGISYCTDSTNLEDDHARNRIRHHILPYATNEINDKAIEHLAHTAASLEKADEYIRFKAREEMDILAEYDDRNRKYTLDLKEFAKCPEIIKENIILLCMEKLTPHRKDITSTHVYNIIRLSETTDGSKKIDLPYELTALREYDKLHIYKESDDKELVQEIQILSKDEITIPKEQVIKGFGTILIDKIKDFDLQNIPEDTYTKMFDYDKIQASLVLRHRQKGDYILTGNGRQSLNKYMINEKIPAAKRDNVYILADNDHVLWVIGYRISSGYKIDSSTKTVLQIKVMEE